MPSLISWTTSDIVVHHRGVRPSRLVHERHARRIEHRHHQCGERQSQPRPEDHLTILVNPGLRRIAERVGQLLPSSTANPPRMDQPARGRDVVDSSGSRPGTTQG